MSDVVERLRIWPAVHETDARKDALSSDFVAALMREAADEIESVKGVALRNGNAAMELSDRVATIEQENARYRSVLEIVAGSPDRLQALQAVAALDNIGAKVGK